MHVHGCLLALHTGKPVKMVYNREESFFGHVHRHPATMHYEYGADRDGTLVYARAVIHLDGGAYASSTPAVVGNAGTMGLGPYVIPNIHMDCYGAYTNNPPCGAMRGFGSVQAAFAIEAIMDKLADAVGLDPVEIRARNGFHEGSTAPTGQVIDSAAPVEELVRRLAAMPLPAPRPRRRPSTCGGCPAASPTPPTARAYAVAWATRSPTRTSRSRRASTTTPRPGSGSASPAANRSSPCTPRPPRSGRAWSRSSSRSAAPSSASTGWWSHPKDTRRRVRRVELGVAPDLCHRRRRQGGLRERPAAGAHPGRDPAGHRRPRGSGSRTAPWSTDRATGVIGLAELLGDDEVEDTVEWRHRPTYPIDPETGQGFAHVQYAFAAHRAVVDVDVDLGLVKVVELACTQDVGKAVNPQAVVGQIQGGSTQGLGLALMEEIQIVEGKIPNPSFTDYLIPTILDTPPMPIEVLEYADPHAPYGLRGVGEAPTISSGPAVAAAIRAATGLDLRRVPIRPEDVTGTR